MSQLASGYPLGPTAAPFTPSEPLYAPGPPLHIRIDLPSDAHCDSTRAHALTADEKPFRVTGALRTAGGNTYQLDSWIGEALCQQIVLSVDLPLDSSRRVTYIELAADPPFVASKLRWESGYPCLDYVEQ